MLPNTTPVLYIIAGPNGSGKSSLYPFFIENGFIPETAPHICSDNIIKELSRTSNYENYFFEGERIANEKRLECIKNNESFVIETNQATNGSYDFVKGVTAKGYKVVMLFVCLGEPNYCIKRVEVRVAMGGHHVPDEIVIHRYLNGISLLRSNIMVFDKCFLFDNSEKAVRLIAATEFNKIIFKSELIPDWAVKSLAIIELINKAKK